MTRAQRRIEELTDEHVTDGEASAVLAWCREWVADCGFDHVEDVSTLPDAVLLAGCNRHVVGGLSFVLADVRLCATLRRRSFNASARRSDPAPSKLGGESVFYAVDSDNYPVRIHAVDAREGAALIRSGVARELLPTSAYVLTFAIRHGAPARWYVFPR